jgi:hypothetical protein
MRRLLALFAPILAFAASPLAAQEIVYEQVTEEIVQVDEAPTTGASARFVAVAPAPVPQGIAAYGPFRVIDARHAALIDVTDEASPGQFTAMLRAWPGIRTLEMIECPGTEDDRANLRLGAMIRAQGIATHVPQGGSVRSGAVELFRAGSRRMADHGAEFAVHSWADDRGLEASDYAASAPENRAYIDYYEKMGMSEAEAQAFYAMTNSVPFADAKWLSAEDMAQWVKLNRETAEPLDSGLALN